MTYRPITDTWICARPKVPYYGAYPAGFLERARALLAVRHYEPVLHVCGGQAREYSALNRGVRPGVPLYGFGPFDLTLDANIALEPNYVADVTVPAWVENMEALLARRQVPIAAILADPPYTEDDADHYTTGRNLLPNPQQLLSDCLHLVGQWHRVGFLHYIWPRPPKDLEVKCIAKISVAMGYGNRDRCYSVWERRS